MTRPRDRVPGLSRARLSNLTHSASHPVKVSTFAPQPDQVAPSRLLASPPCAAHLAKTDPGRAGPITVC